MVCKRALQDLLITIQSKSEVIRIGDSCVISTPFIHSSGEFINIYFTDTKDHKIKLHDNGETLSELCAYGVDPLGNKESKSYLLLDRLLQKFRFSLDGWVIFKECEDGEIGTSSLDAINLLKSVFDLMYLHQATTTNTFKTLVSRFLRSSNIVFSADHVEGGTTIEHKIDYVVKPTSTSPRIFLNTYSGKRTFDLAIRSQFTFQDMKKAGKTFQWIPVINPEDDWNTRSLNIIRTYADDVVDWGDKNRVIELCRY